MQQIIALLCLDLINHVGQLFEPFQNQSLGFPEGSCAVAITNTPQVCTYSL